MDADAQRFKEYLTKMGEDMEPPTAAYLAGIMDNMLGLLKTDACVYPPWEGFKNPNFGAVLFDKPYTDEMIRAWRLVKHLQIIRDRAPRSFFTNYGGNAFFLPIPVGILSKEVMSCLHSFPLQFHSAMRILS